MVFLLGEVLVIDFVLVVIVVLLLVVPSAVIVVLVKLRCQPKKNARGQNGVEKKTDSRNSLTLPYLNSAQVLGMEQPVPGLHQTSNLFTYEARGVYPGPSRVSDSPVSPETSLNISP